VGRAPRACAFCKAPLPSELGPAARYCSRAHRQRAYEARQDAAIARLQRRIRALERQLASFERIIENAADHDDHCARVIADALLVETEAAFAMRRAAGANPRPEG